MKRWTILILSIMVWNLFAVMASAHVTVNPSKTTQGSYEVFTMRVPSEQDGYTTKVEVRIEEGVDISRVEPKPGWTYEMERDGNGKVTSIAWTAEGEGLGKTEFTEFRMQGKVGEEASSITWRAYQTYSDGSTAEWTGGEGSDMPASVTTVEAKPEGAGTDSHGHVTATAGEEAQSGQGQSQAASPSLSLYLSIAALVVALIALLVVIGRGRKSQA